MLVSEEEVIRCLVTYTDWWQTPTTSVIELRPSYRSRETHDKIFRPGFVERLDERQELLWRVAHLAPVDREILYRYYVLNHAARDVAEAVGLSTRQCLRRRRQSLETLVQLGEQ